jgi:RNase P subunit RPR2
VDGTNCEQDVIFEQYTEEQKALLRDWWMKSDMDNGRSMMGTYCPSCASVLLTAIKIRHMISQQRQRETMNFFGKLYERFQKKQHQYWGQIQAMSRKKEKGPWEDVYLPIIAQCKEDKLPVYHVDTNETIIIIKKDVLDEKYGKKEEADETVEEKVEVQEAN